MLLGPPRGCSGRRRRSTEAVPLDDELKCELAHSLHCGHSRRKPHRDPEARTSRFVDAMTPLAERPGDVEERSVPGALGGRSHSRCGRPVRRRHGRERASRYVVLGHLPVERTADAVRDSLINAMGDLPASLRRTLTWDQGAEMSEHRSFTMATDMQVYFCDPASP